MYRATLLLLLVTTTAFAAQKPAEKAEAADATYAFQFKNAELGDAIQAYSKITGQKFVIDANIHGRVTILNPHKVSKEEAFNLLSTAMATNGVAISEQGDTMVVSQARMIQRDLIPVVSELPPIKPERMVSWVVDFRHIDADDVNMQLRMLSSSQGEVYPFGRNQIIFTDWVSNLYRVRDLIAKIDKPGYQAPKERKKN